MLILISAVSFLAVIIVLILAHELGHFITAKASGVKVEEFGLFYPPRIFGIRKGETLYSLNAIPLGGFTKMSGEEDPKVTRSLASKSAGTRILVLSAGSIMNFLLPIILFSVAFMVPHYSLVGQVKVLDVAADSPAAIAGMRIGDTVFSINNIELSNSNELYRFLQLNLGKDVTLVVQHTDGSIQTVHLIPRWRPPQGQRGTGIEITTANGTIVQRSYPFWKAIPLGVEENMQTFGLFKNGIISMIIGTQPVQLTGPVGIAQLTGEVAQAGFSPLLEFAAFLSINLAIINIFPLPALDGGRIAFVFIEWVRRGKRISPKTEGLVHLIGFIVLMAFFLAITYQDIIRIISGEKLM